MDIDDNDDGADAADEFVSFFRGNNDAVSAIVRPPVIWALIGYTGRLLNGAALDLPHSATGMTCATFLRVVIAVLLLASEM